MLARFAQCWGSLEACRGGMSEVIGAVGSMLKALLLLIYFFAVKTMTDLGPTSIRLLVLRPWWSFAASLRLRQV